MTIVAYYGKLKKLWEDLTNHQQIPACMCGGCTCNLASKLEKKREKEKIHQFLMGLNETIYRTVRSNILAQDHLPSLNKIYSTLVQEECVRIVTRGKEEHNEIMSFAIQSARRFHGRTEGKDRNIIYNNCNRSGHDSENCFQLVGYPEW